MIELAIAVMLAVAACGEEPPEHVREYLARCAAAKATSVSLPLPAAQDDMGTLDAAAINVRMGRSVVVLEVVDEDEAIVRAWHPLADAPRDRPPQLDELSFVDLWIAGIDTGTLAVGEAAKLPHVFHVAGSKLFDTTCGKRSLPLLVPVDVERYRKK